MRSRRTLYPLLGVAVLVMAAACSSSATHDGEAAPPRLTTGSAATSPTFVSTTVPDTQVGAQFTWVLGAVRAAPLSHQVIEAHFDSNFLRQASASKVNSVLTQLRSSSGASLVGLLSETSTSFKAVAKFGDTEVTVSISVDGAGLIDGLLFELYVPPPPTSWAQLDRKLEALAPSTGMLAARVSSDGPCIPIHKVASTTARPLGSMFKLFVLGALAHQITAGRVTWNQELTVQDALKSIGSTRGSLQYSPAGTQVSVQQTATQMISISDNTAADMLINLVGRSAVEVQVQQWASSAALDNPFLTTRELFLLHYVDYPTLANQYLHLDPNQRAAFLSSTVDPLALSQIQGSTNPRDTDTVEWFASPRDVCRAFAGLQRLSTQSGMAPIGTILSDNVGGLVLDRTQWPTVWFKGGSEPGVLTLGYLAKNGKGQTFVVAVMLGNPTAALSPSATGGLIALVTGAFGLLG